MQFKQIEVTDRIGAYRRIMASQGKIFGLTFQKMDGSFREGTFRIGVKKGITGQGLAFDPIDKGLVTVYDCQNKGFRMFSLSRLHSVRLNNKVYWIKTEGGAK